MDPAPRNPPRILAGQSRRHRWQARRARAQNFSTLGKICPQLLRECLVHSQAIRQNHQGKAGNLHGSMHDIKPLFEFSQHARKALISIARKTIVIGQNADLRQKARAPRIGFIRPHTGKDIANVPIKVAR